VEKIQKFGFLRERYFSHPKVDGPTRPGLGQNILTRTHLHSEGKNQVKIKRLFFTKK